MRWTGERVIRLRDALGLTRKELATILKLHWFSVGRWERGEYRPGAEAEAKLDALLVLALKHEERRVETAVEAEEPEAEEPEDDDDDLDDDDDEEPEDEPDEPDEDEPPTESIE